MEFLVGRNVVREALLAHRRKISQVLIAEGVAEKGAVVEILRLCQETKTPVSRVGRREFNHLAGDLPHQGLAAQASPYPYVGVEDLLALAAQHDEAPFLLALDSLQDPQNVGTLMRTAEAVGVHGVILPDRRAASVTPAVSRASAGAAEHLSVAMVTNLARTLDALKKRGVWAVGVEDLASAQDYRSVDLHMPLVVVMGSEGGGMRRLVAEKCDLLLRIPMRGQVNSLNVSVAGGIVLYRAWEARQ